eukprot:5778450-Prymnesium_polylepis.1
MILPLRQQRAPPQDRQWRARSLPPGCPPLSKACTPRHVHHSTADLLSTSRRVGLAHGKQHATPLTTVAWRARGIAMLVTTQAKRLILAHSHYHRLRTLAPVACKHREPLEGCSCCSAIGHGDCRSLVNVHTRTAVDFARGPLARHVVLIEVGQADAGGNPRLAITTVGGRVARAGDARNVAALASVGVICVCSAADLICTGCRAEVARVGYGALGCKGQICRARVAPAAAW